MPSDKARYARRKAEIAPRMEGERVCSKCAQTRPITDFYAHPLGIDGRAPACQDCERDRLQIRKHGLTRAQKDATAEQQGGCAICKRETPGGKGWVVDHNHACCDGEKSCEKCRRGVLCQWCNAALGYALDRPNVLRAMADYLETYLALPIAGPTATPIARTNITNGLTKKVLTTRGHIASGDAREEHQKVVCVCSDELNSCPDNCFLRWF